MNHLVGLDFPVPDPSQDLSMEDSKILAQFRHSYDARKPQQDNLPPLTSQIESTASLPPSGWRPLDDNTLYRFLCADLDKQGNFQPDLSLQRLLNALQFRRERKCDEVLNIPGHVYCPTTVATPQQLVRSDSCQSIASVASSLLVGTFNDDQDIVQVLVEVPLSSSKPSKQFLPLQSFGSTRTTTSTTTTTTTTTSNTVTAPLPPSYIPISNLEKYQRLRVRVFTGYGHNGNPVLFERLGAFMGSGNVSLFTLEEWIDLYVWDLERHFWELRQASLRANKPIEKYVFFGDMDGIVGSIVRGSIWGVLPLLKALVKTVEDHYPEIVSHIVVFNVPKIATAVWLAIKAFLDPVTVAKVQLCSGFPKEQALALMDESVIPKEYGGTCLVPFPKTARK